MTVDAWTGMMDPDSRKSSMIDPSLMPPLPEPDCGSVLIGRKEIGLNHSDEAMTAYGLQCYQLAMERAADLAYDAAIRYAQGYAVDFKAEFGVQEKTNG